MRDVLRLAGLLMVFGPAAAQESSHSSSTIVIQQVAASGERLALTLLQCPSDRCSGELRLDASGPSFGMAVRVDLGPSGARIALRGCNPATAECAPYGAGSDAPLHVPLGPDGNGTATFHVAPVVSTTIDNIPDLFHPTWRRAGDGNAFRLAIEVARPPAGDAVAPSRHPADQR